jgi:hypothetical protein
MEGTTNLKGNTSSTTRNKDITSHQTGDGLCLSENLIIHIGGSNQRVRLKECLTAGCEDPEELYKMFLTAGYNCTQILWTY